MYCFEPDSTGFFVISNHSIILIQVPFFSKICHNNEIMEFFVVLLLGYAFFIVFVQLIVCIFPSLLVHIARIMFANVPPALS